MGTRGLVGFRVSGEDKLTCNNFDSYPEVLGRSCADFIEDIDINAARKRVSAIKQTDNWDAESYGCMLGRMLESGKYQDHHEFIEDSLWCEWAYIINLDDEVLEIYKGFQTRPHSNGRYARISANTLVRFAIHCVKNWLRRKLDSKAYVRGMYFPCALIIEIPFSEIDKFDERINEWYKANGYE